MADWTTTETEQARDLWQAGYSAGEIARKLGRSRNAVIGKVHRDRLPKRETITTRGGLRKIWTHADTDRLVALVGEGHSTLTIAAMMGRGERTISTHVAQCRSEGLVTGITRVRRATRKPVRRGHPSWAPIPYQARPEPAVEAPTTPPVRLADIGFGQCRYVADDPNGPDTLCCGAKTKPGKSWCAYHHALVFQPPEERRRVR